MEQDTLSQYSTEKGPLTCHIATANHREGSLLVSEKRAIAERPEIDAWLFGGSGTWTFGG